MEEEREITDCLKGGKGVGFLLLRVNDRRQKPCLFFHMYHAVAAASLLIVCFVFAGDCVRFSFYRETASLAAR